MIDQKGLSLVESARIRDQVALDALKTPLERNRLGQFATPPRLADAILEETRNMWSGTKPVRFLDPAVGTGAFFSALSKTFPPTQVESAVGYEIDGDFARRCSQLWSPFGLHVENVDFTEANPTDGGSMPNLVVCNPPYVRHHHIRNNRDRLLRVAYDATGIEPTGLSGLYCYFMLASHRWMAPGALAAWLIPTEFMAVNYGKSLREYLTTKVDLVRIHRFDPEHLQFADALVSSCVVWFWNRPPRKLGRVHVSFGGTIQAPLQTNQLTKRNLSESDRWTLLVDAHMDSPLPHTPTVTFGDLFQVKRGIATGNNSFFVIPPERARELGIPEQFQTPVIPSPRHMNLDHATAELVPRLHRLIDCSLDEAELERRHPQFWAYLESGIKSGMAASYLASKRRPWYSQERRLPPIFFMTYMTRSNRKNFGFKVILNESRAVAMNVWLLLYPKPRLAALLEQDNALLKKLWKSLQHIASSDLSRYGRVYGGGLYKLEPRELMHAPIDEALTEIPELRGLIEN